WPQMPAEVVEQVQSKEPIRLTLGLLSGMLEQGGNLVPATLARCRELPAIRSHAARLGLCRPGEFNVGTVTAIADLLRIEKGIDSRTAYALTLDAVAPFLAGRANGSGQGRGLGPLDGGGQRNKGQGEGNAGGQHANERNAGPAPGRDEQIRQMEPAVRRAYLA